MKAQKRIQERIQKTTMMKAGIFASAMMIMAPALGGNFQGNGFISPGHAMLKFGQSIRQYLLTNDKGRELAKEFGVNDGELKTALEKTRVSGLDVDYKITAETLYKAMGGSAIDAEEFSGRLEGVETNLKIWSGDELGEMYPVTIPKAPPLQVADAVTYGGSGCPANSDSVETVVDTRRGVLSVSFASVFAAPEGQGLARSNCTLAMPLTIPDGYRLQVEGSDMLGHFALESKAKASANLEVFFAGGREPIGNVAFRSKEGESREGRLFISQDGGASTTCGASVILRANASVTAQTMTLDSIAAGSLDRLIVRYKLVACD